MAQVKWDFSLIKTQFFFRTFAKEFFNCHYGEVYGYFLFYDALFSVP